MMASAEDGTWVVPEGHALWIPPRLPHAVATHGAVAMCSAYLDPDAVADFPTGCRVIAVSPLLAAALAALAEEPVLYDQDGRGGHLAALVLDEIGRAPATPLTLPLPRDPRLRRVCLGIDRGSGPGVGSRCLGRPRRGEPADPDAWFPRGDGPELRRLAGPGPGDPGAGPGGRGPAAAGGRGGRRVSERAGPADDRGAGARSGAPAPWRRGRVSAV